MTKPDSDLKRREMPLETLAGSGARLLEEGAAFRELTALTANGTRMSDSPARGGATGILDRRSRTDGSGKRERFDVVIIGAGQAGLSVGYHLAKQGLRFVILDAEQRVGDAWRKRWDSLRLFTPARYDGLDGMPFPAPPFTFPTKDQMADYLEAYAAHFQLPIRTGVKVDRLSQHEGRFLVEAGSLRLEADQVVIAMASYQRPRVPSFAGELAPEIVQLHSSDYRNPSQLKPGPVLIAGAGNSGADIAMELSRHHRTCVSGRDTGHVPFRIDGFWARLFLTRLVLRFVFHRVLTVKTRLGRKVRPKILQQGTPLIRLKPKDLAAAGIERVSRVVGVRNGLPLLDSGRVLDVANVIWSTGYHPGFSWVDLPIVDDDGEPGHDGGVVTSVPGLYFVGLHFLYSMSSTMIHGVGRDAARIARTVAAHARVGISASDHQPKPQATQVATG